MVVTCQFCFVLLFVWLCINFCCVDVGGVLGCCDFLVAFAWVVLLRIYKSLDYCCSVRCGLVLLYLDLCLSDLILFLGWLAVCLFSVLVGLPCGLDLCLLVCFSVGCCFLMGMALV